MVPNKGNCLPMMKTSSCGTVADPTDAAKLPHSWPGSETSPPSSTSSRSHRHLIGSEALNNQPLKKGVEF